MFQRRDLLLPALLIVHLASAQGPAWTAPLPALQQGGVHAVLLTPEWMGLSRNDLGDIRLLDSAGVEVPYVLREQALDRASSFVPYELLRNEVLPKATVIELERPADRQLEYLEIWVRPADVQKEARITGSDDRAHWYMVKDQHLLSQGARGDPPHQVLSVRLPRSDYRYFRIALNDSLTPPMRVLGIGHFVGSAPVRRFAPSIPLHMEQQDSARSTRLKVSNAHPLAMDRLRFTVSDTTAFRRTGQLRAWHTTTYREGRRTRTVRQASTVATFTIASDLAPVIDLPTIRADTFDLVIDNGDDRPLHFTRLEALVAERLLVAQLDPGNRYRLTTGDADRNAPQYDMAHFAEDLAAPVDTLAPGAPEAIPAQAASSPDFDPAKWWIWAVIIVLMAGMGWMAVRMLRMEG